GARLLHRLPKRAAQVHRDVPEVARQLGLRARESEEELGPHVSRRSPAPGAPPSAPRAAATLPPGSARATRSGGALRLAPRPPAGHARGGPTGAPAGSRAFRRAARWPAARRRRTRRGGRAARWLGRRSAPPAHGGSAR